MLADRRSTGPFTARWYNDRVLDAAGRPTGETRPVWSIAPESLIVSPAQGATVEAGRTVEVWGWAWADAAVDSVDVSVDGGRSCTQAALESRAGRAGQRFTATWRPNQRGDYELSSRAHSQRQSQPSTGARNALLSVPITVL